jgi:arsenate reductase-like glutaredoxin family protein
MKPSTHESQNTSERKKKASKTPTKTEILETMETMKTKLNKFVRNIGDSIQALKDLAKEDSIEKEDIKSAITELLNGWVDTRLSK